MANVKSLSDAESREERIEKIGGIGGAHGFAETRGSRADAVCEKDEVGEWRSGGEERAGLDQRRRAAA